MAIKTDQQLKPYWANQKTNFRATNHERKKPHNSNITSSMKIKKTTTLPLDLTSLNSSVAVYQKKRKG